ncbi:MAG TPA: bifunctional DNA-formamidopyrimidine glycosylase/DNA-(apurinic or apyrimidinic site) lyase [Lacisediminihabitans sp.]|nr:bifunctional DNA-formamidopyrimidine glycosylase/DNA-(apurinic or apyrimidinic site) lyase [Lacisediminihabitans sp.]HXD61512.1 bifunctional DNA-formamidopyrimidine glycosylase/DNA-(apurinic or apyrimidinic site) lyase [Lacisediminihabitans sp.]
MPELPEVEVVRAGLAPAVTGATVASVTVFDERSLRRHPGPSEDFVARLVGRGFTSAVRRGKFLWLPLAPVLSKTQETRPEPHDSARFAPEAHRSPAFSAAPSEALVVHLGMSGQVLLREPGAPDDALTRIRIELSSPVHGILRMNFADQRIFGSMAIEDLTPTRDGQPGGYAGQLPVVEPVETSPALASRPPRSAPALIPRSVAHIARDPLDPAFDERAFFAALAKRRTGIKRALLDQSLISGIGNIYADEALWAARIHYDQQTGTLSRATARTLLAEVRHVLAKALGEGGTSFDAQYVNVNGASGYFSHSLNAYGQQGKPCPRCGRPIVREQFMNRGSHFCPHCQRLRR